VSSSIAGTAAGRAVLDAARHRTVGAPVYLRYAVEAPSTTPSDALIWHAADALTFAAEVLGNPLDVYASAARDAAGQPVSLAITVRHADGCVALLGIGSADVPRQPATLLFLGDQGAIEGNPAFAGAVLRDGLVTPLRDGMQPLAGRPPAGVNSLAMAAAAAIHRSLVSARAERLEAR
jgi:hypothetical protein